MDAYGRVNDVEFLRYLEEARIALLVEAAANGGVTTLLGEVVVVRHEIDYRRPLTFRPEPVLVEPGSAPSGTPRTRSATRCATRVRSTPRHTR